MKSEQKFRYVAAEIPVEFTLGTALEDCQIEAANPLDTRTSTLFHYPMRQGGCPKSGRMP